MFNRRPFNMLHFIPFPTTTALTLPRQQLLGMPTFSPMGMPNHMAPGMPSRGEVAEIEQGWRTRKELTAATLKHSTQQRCKVNLDRKNSGGKEVVYICAGKTVGSRFSCPYRIVWKRLKIGCRIHCPTHVLGCRLNQHSRLLKTTFNSTS